MGFIKLASELAYGQSVQEWDQAVADIIRGCRDHQKDGELVLKFKFTPEKGGQILILDSFKATVPEADRMKTIMYVQRDGSLGRRDPRQPELPMREVTLPAEPAGGQEENVG